MFATIEIAGNIQSGKSGERLHAKNLTLSPIQSQQMFMIYHDMRYRMLFRLYGKPYDKYHPDELNTNNHRRILLLDNEPIGTIRIDIEESEARFRLVTIREDLQKQGYGSRLVQMAEEFAFDNGCSEVIIISGSESVGFWLKCGYLPEKRNSPRIIKKSLTTENHESLTDSAYQKPPDE